MYELDSHKLTYHKLTFSRFVKKNYVSWIIGAMVVSYISILLFKMLFLPDLPISEIKKLKPQYEEIMLLQTQYEFTEDKL